MNPILSIKARRKNFVMNHFLLTKYSRQLKTYQNIHLGEICFIIGNGPSLSAEDLTLIHKHNIISFGFNRIYLMFSKTDWRPTYYVSQDEKTLKNCISNVNEMKIENKFIPLNLKYYYDINVKKAVYFKILNKGEDYPVLSDDISSFITNTTTVAVTAAQIAAYMGFKKIYLLGVDHSFSTYQNDKGEIINDNSVKDYFSDDYNKDKAELYIPNLDASARAFISMKKFCAEKGIEVYNATRGGKLEVFPRVNFDEVINNI